MHQRVGHIRARAGTVARRQDGVEPAKQRDGQRFRTARRLLQSRPLADEQGGARDHQGLETQGLQVAFDLALDPVVEDARMRVGTHGRDHAAACGAGRARGAGRGQHGVVVDRPKGALAACRGDGGAQRDVDIIHGRQGGQGRKVHGVQVQPWVAQCWRAPALGMQHMHRRGCRCCRVR